MPRISSLIAIGLISFFTIAYMVLSFSNYSDFQAGIDLAGYNQNVWNLLEGRLPWNSFKGFVMWGDHAHFIMALFTPLYAFWPSAKLILAVQALAYTTAAWPLFLLARKRTTAIFALALSYSYLAFIGGQYALNFDFHPSVLTGAAIIWMVYGLLEKKSWLTWLALGLGLITREDAPTIFFMVGIWFIFTQLINKTKKEKLTGLKTGLAISTISAVYFLATVYVIMPIWTPDGAVLTYLDGYETKSVWDIGKGFILYPDTILQNIVDTEAKKNTLANLPKTFSYLPLLSPFAWLTSAPIIFARFNSPHDYRWLLTNHSNANIAPLLALGALFGAIWISKAATLARQYSKNVLLKRILFAVLAAGLVWGTQATAWSDKAIPLRISYKQDYSRPDEKKFQARREAFKELSQLIPADAAVTASSGFTPHLAQRRFINNFDGVENVNPTTDYILLAPDVYNWPLNAGQTAGAVKQLIENNEWQEIAEQNNTWLFQKQTVDNP